MLNLDYFRMLSMMFIWGLVSDSRRQRRRVVVSVVASRRHRRHRHRRLGVTITPSTRLR